MAAADTAQADQSSADEVAKTADLLDKASLQSSAAERVLTTTELLEKILLHVVDNPAPTRLRTVLCSQRVNSMFHNTIQGSSAIKRALMLLPQTARQPRLARINPLLAFQLTSNGALQVLPFTISYKKRTSTQIELRIEINMSRAWDQVTDPASWHEMLLLDAPGHDKVTATVHFTHYDTYLGPIHELQLDSVSTAAGMMYEALRACAADTAKWA